VCIVDFEVAVVVVTSHFGYSCLIFENWMLTLAEQTSF